MNKKIAHNWYYVLGVVIAGLLVLHYTGVFKKMFNTENNVVNQDILSQEKINELQDNVDAELKDGQGFDKIASHPIFDTTGYTTTQSGLMYKVVTLSGNTEQPTATSRVTVHYTGTLMDGTVFDSSRERGQPATFGLNQVISGWTEGLQLMHKGDTYEFIIPSDLAYGPSGSGHELSGKALKFNVELIDIN